MDSAPIEVASELAGHPRVDATSIDSAQEPARAIKSRAAAALAADTATARASAVP